MNIVFLIISVEGNYFYYGIVQMFSVWSLVPGNPFIHQSDLNTPVTSSLEIYLSIIYHRVDIESLWFD